MFIDTNGIELGDWVRDETTGIEGLVTAVTKWTTGCARIALQPPLDKDGKRRDAEWSDVLICTVIERGRFKLPDATATTPSKGGPRPDPVSQRNDPSR